MQFFMCFFIPALLGFLSTGSLAARNIPLGGKVCGSTVYTRKQIRSAYIAGCSSWLEGKTIGPTWAPSNTVDSSGFPRYFKRSVRGFGFKISGPYVQFPILESGKVYDGGEHAGSHRVLFTKECRYVGAVILVSGGAVNCDSPVSQSIPKDDLPPKKRKMKSSGSSSGSKNTHSPEWSGPMAGGASSSTKYALRPKRPRPIVDDASSST